MPVPGMVPVESAGSRRHYTRISTVVWRGLCRSRAWHTMRRPVHRWGGVSLAQRKQSRYPNRVSCPRRLKSVFQNTSGSARQVLCCSCHHAMQIHAIFSAPLGRIRFPVCFLRLTYPCSPRFFLAPPFSCATTCDNRCRLPQVDRRLGETGGKKHVF